jgi:hypothetical protein
MPLTLTKPSEPSRYTRARTVPDEPYADSIARSEFSTALAKARAAPSRHIVPLWPQACAPRSRRERLTGLRPYRPSRERGESASRGKLHPLFRVGRQELPMYHGSLVVTTPARMLRQCRVCLVGKRLKWFSEE